MYRNDLLSKDFTLELLPLYLQHLKILTVTMSVNHLDF